MTPGPTHRLVAVDLDGTLLDASHELRRADREAIDRFRADGGRLVLATGRVPPMALPFAHDLGLVEPVICANGGWVGTPSRERMFGQQFMEPQLGSLLRVCRTPRFDGRVIVFSSELGFVGGWTAVIDAYQRQRSAPLVVSDGLAACDTTPALKAMFYLHVSELDALNGELDDGDLADCEVRVGRIGSLEGFPETVGVEVSPPGVDKCAALLRLAEVLGVQREQVASVGDGSNDAAMLRWAGRGFAVADGDPTALDAADCVVGGGDAPPVADALARLRCCGSRT